MRPLDTALNLIALLLSLRVDFRDSEAASRITPKQADAYLRVHGWRYVLDTAALTVFDRGEGTTEQAFVPRAGTADYGDRMSMLVSRIAEQEERSPLATFAEMVTLDA